MFSVGTFVPIPKVLSIESPENTCSSPSPAQMMQRSTCRLCSERGINAICGGPLLLQFTGVVDFALKKQLGYSFQIYVFQTWTFSLLCPSYSLLGFRRPLQSWIHNIRGNTPQQINTCGLGWTVCAWVSPLHPCHNHLQVLGNT